MKIRHMIIKTCLVIALSLSTVTVPAQAASFSTAERDRYLAGYRQGVLDAQHHQQHEFQDAFIRAGYERGWREGSWKVQSDTNGTASVTTGGPTLPGANDNADFHYNLSQPTAKQKEFFDKLGPLAVKIGKQYDLYPSIMLAQAALESNFGSGELASRHHNLMGVKAGDGLPSVTMMTSEQDQRGHSYTVKAAFRQYKDWEESLEDYANVLETEQFRAVHRHEAGNYQNAIRALRGTYATDVHYDRKLTAIIKAFDLTKYDEEVEQAGKRPQYTKPESFKPQHVHQKMAVRSHRSQVRRKKRHHHVGVMSVAGGLVSLAFLKVKKLHH